MLAGLREAKLSEVKELKSVILQEEKLNIYNAI